MLIKVTIFMQVNIFVLFVFRCLSRDLLLLTSLNVRFEKGLLILYELLP